MPPVRYDCAILVPEDVWNDVDKAWVPQRFTFPDEPTCKGLWWDEVPGRRKFTVKLP